MSDLIADRGNPHYSDDGIQLKGEPGIKGKRRERRMMQLANSVFARREKGMTIEEIAEDLHTSHHTVGRILHDTKMVKQRLDSYNEQVRARIPKSIKAIDELLDSKDPAMLGKKADVALQVLQLTKVVGKDSPVNVFIKGGDTVVNVSNDTLEAAKAVSQAMMAAAKVRSLPQVTSEPPEQGGTADSIDAEVISEETSGSDSGTSNAVGQATTPTEENSTDEHTRIDVGQPSDQQPSNNDIRGRSSSDGDTVDKP